MLGIVRALQHTHPIEAIREAGADRILDRAQELEDLFLLADPIARREVRRAHIQVEPLRAQKIAQNAGEQQRQQSRAPGVSARAGSSC